MKSTTRTMLRRAASTISLVAAVTTLSACGDDNDSPTPTPTMSPSPTPAPTSGQANFDVTSCLQQQIPGTGFTVAQAVVPDTLTINLDAASGFPNGRKLTDPVIDVTLAVVFLDLTKNAPTVLVGLNPTANDVAFRSSFPYLAPPQGSPPLADSSGTNFTFRTNAPSAYTRVDRMGMPAVSTALIPSDTKTAYNDGDPIDDVNGAFTPALVQQLTGLTNALADDLAGAGLSPCATPK